MKNIELREFRKHSKASERYVDVSFTYHEKTIYTSVPIEYRRTGLDIPGDDTKAITEYLDKIYDELNPKNWDNWRNEQKKFWNEKANAGVTKAFFDGLAQTFDYTCVNCQLPQNPNWARRIQDLKEFGYTIATELARHCPHCKKNTTHLILLPIKRGGVTGYETWSPELRERIVNLLNSYDVFEAKQIRKEGLLPDHKFSEIRWDENTKRDSLEDLTDADILKDFQLMSNQRNQQKREVCRNCYQTGKRGIIYGIPFFYEGTEEWDQTIPKKGKDAEKGCIGCAWYDIERWRKALLEKLTK
ncbi:MAG: restriction endonuclease [Treponema sp.]|nr:restriction endonuclease [Treponema sp.]